MDHGCIDRSEAVQDAHPFRFWQFRSSLDGALNELSTPTDHHQRILEIVTKLIKIGFTCHRSWRRIWHERAFQCGRFFSCPFPIAHSVPHQVHRLRVAHQIFDYVQHLPQIEWLTQVSVRAEAVCLLASAFQQLRAG